MENIECKCDKCPLAFCRFCECKIQKWKGYWLLEYLKLEEYRIKYGFESDKDPTLIIDEEIPRLFLGSGAHPQRRSHSCNELFEWKRHNDFGAFYETRRLIAVCSSCVGSHSTEKRIEFV